MREEDMSSEEGFSKNEAWAVHEDHSWNYRGVNWPGVLGGLLLLALPFLGPWWFLKFGSDAFHVSVSPFMAEIRNMGVPVFSPLLYWLNIAFLILILIFGMEMLLGSLVSGLHRYRDISGVLVCSAAKKPLILVIVFFAAVLAVSLTMDRVVALFGITGFSGNIPLIAGGSVVTISNPGLVLLVPVAVELSPVFFLSIAISFICLFAGYWQEKGVSDDPDGP
ncbi:hypothetical protein F1737_11435 [Methanoplanus sp. FWC-SCC4]|uniref:Uncharacterized protein n=1 Tax=Methanochimaera problematica TaxID=2609417 RepID=A0AA97FFU3_9EURY|nr:hypothetical protein [Methanoplanus sp. FWC-SCC4]WOF17243.1 hypothetical protein F1737_11435 [Methanoplanus sp. FWC-SCC4]